MYYRILDSNSADYLPVSYNTTDLNVVREELECALLYLSDDGPMSVRAFKKLVDLAANAGLHVESSKEPFETSSTYNIDEFDKILNDDWDDLDCDLDYDYRNEPF